MSNVIRVDFTKRPATPAPSEPATVHVLVPRHSAGRAAAAYALYVEGSRLDEDPATYDAAEAIYLRAIALDPSLAIAHTNVGNIRHRRGDTQGAIAFYESALRVDRHQPEAHYNLGYLALERGDARAAIEHLGRALDADPRFADAHYNRAMAFEQVADHASAVPHWRRYLEIEPSGMWTVIARDHLGLNESTAKRPARQGRRPRRQALPDVVDQNVLPAMAEWLKGRTP